MKLRIAIFTAAVIFLMSAATFGQFMRSTFYHGENAYLVEITSDDLEKTPSWNPETEDAAPLSSREALKIARTNLARFVVEAVDNWRLDAFTLHRMGQNKWYYAVKFRCLGEECREEYDVFSLYVKMDGKLVEPEVKPRDSSK